MRTGIYYMNNNGSKWVVFGDDGRRVKYTFETKSGNKVERCVNYFESFGNFATLNISYHGKRINVFADTKLDDL